VEEQKSKSRSPSGMTTRRTTATAKPERRRRLQNRKDKGDCKNRKDKGDCKNKKEKQKQQQRLTCGGSF
jgi:hypothetical protein